jgi:hypothetical protein
MHRKLPLSPIKYLYSGDGIDFYSAIFRFTNYNPPVSAPYDIGMVLVYQDEATRQQIISASRGAVAIRKSDGTEPSLENFKFVVIRCVNNGKDFLSSGKCLANDVRYYKPQACIVVPKAQDFSDLANLAASGARNYRDTINALNWLAEFAHIADKTRAIGGKPKYFELRVDALGMLKEFAANNQVRWRTSDRHVPLPPQHRVR